jgi:hypothetical protein
MINLDLAVVNLLASIIVNIIVLSPALWISGRLLAGVDKAKFTDALWIVVLGTVIGAVFQYLFQEGIIVLIILLVIWLGLVKHFFDTGWLRALVIAIVAVIIWLVIMIILAVLLGIGLAILGLGGFFG